MPLMETIPAELGALILENVPDMGSLWAFIRASPHIYSIFSNYREKVLPIVVAREIGPVLLGEALAALNSSRFTPHQRVKGEDTKIFIRGLPKLEALEWIEKYYLPRSEALQWVEGYLFEAEKLQWSENYNKEEINRRNASPPPEEMLLLWDLHKDVRFIADLYVRETSHIFNESVTDIFAWPASKPLPHTLGDLSFVERQRIFRAIYRFVIFGNLFAPSPVSIWHEEDLCEYFLCRFTAWQVEEISCIHDFITDMVLQKWQEMEDNEFNRLAADPKLWELEPRPDPWNCRWDADFFSRSSKLLDFEEKQAFLTTLPIKNLRAIFQAKGEILEELVRKQALEYRGEGGNFLGDALAVEPMNFPVNPGGEAFRDDAWVDGVVPFLDREKDDNVMSANVAWYWTNNWRARELYVWSTSNCRGEEEDKEGFRRLGYVFWDYPRWESFDCCE